jgi:adenylate cyclase
MRAFPFDSNTPGVEGHATILDNLLAGDMLISTTAGPGFFWILILMSVGAILIAYMTERLDSVKALLSFIGAMALLGTIDVHFLFTRNQVNWNTSLLLAQLSAIFVFTISAKYVLEERSRKFIKGAFSKYVSAAVVDAIVKNPDKLSLGGDKKDLSILFSDIRGFTTLSEKMDPKALTGFLNTYLTDMTKIVFNTKGTLDKYIGDAVMAFWGAPIDSEDHASQSCEAAIQMQRKLDLERARFKQEFGINVEVGIGINSGVVSVGNMGSNDNLSYTVIGDDVNLASRLEGLTKYYGVKIVTTRQTIERIEAKSKTPPPHRTLDFVKVKGKKQAVEIIQVMEKEYPLQSLSLFQEARGFYAIREWDQAIAKFKQSIETMHAALGESDGPSEMYLERCEYFKQNPPPSNWDGSWEMTSK